MELLDLFSITVRALLGFLILSLAMWRIGRVPGIVKDVFRGLTYLLGIVFFCTLLIGP